MEHVIGLELSLNDNGETLSTEFLDNRQNFDWTTVMGAVCHEIIGPDMMAMGGP